YAADGAPLTDPLPVPRIPGGFMAETRGRGAATPDGFVGAWEQGRVEKSSVLDRARVVQPLPLAGPAGRRIRLGDVGGVDFDVAVNAGGLGIVVWSERMSASTFANQIRAMMVDPAAGAASDIATVTPDRGDVTGDIGPSIAAGPDGRFLVVWTR